MFDTRVMARHSWGFLGSGLTESDAKIIVSLAGEMGIKTLLLEDEKVAVIPEPDLVNAVSCEKDAFYFMTGLEPGGVKIQWKDICLFSAICLNEDTMVEKTVKEGRTKTQKIMSLGITMTTGIPIKIGKDREVSKQVAGRELHFFADIFINNPDAAARRLHIDAEKLDFSYLSARIMPNVMGNFNLLVRDIAGQSTSSIMNKGVRTLLAGQPFTAAGYSSRADYEKECRWLLTLAKL